MGLLKKGRELAVALLIAMATFFSVIVSQTLPVLNGDQLSDMLV